MIRRQPEVQAFLLLESRNRTGPIPLVHPAQRCDRKFDRTWCKTIRQ